MISVILCQTILSGDQCHLYTVEPC